MRRYRCKIIRVLDLLECPVIPILLYSTLSSHVSLNYPCCDKNLKTCIVSSISMIESLLVARSSVSSVKNLLKM